ncbi:hypothetical protein FB562_0457 [Homoserinimonas aerilata]|uniref:Uncharacterized protein n=1 Tax=Homoserinimonas aerilata TaxID=1162970 RepID=A0A542YH18_9MICO|nr:hypothetical protein [Homoserinimonas aerilata]TQL47399.1 hypothetical protein FB562_0457 [Homoserinimonas aerilata]
MSGSERIGTWSDWTELLAAIDAYGGSGSEVRRRADADGVSLEVVGEGLSRAAELRNRLADSVLPDFTSWEATPPGLLDLRVFDQDLWWVDVVRRPHRVADMSGEYLANVIDSLRRGKVDFCQAYHCQYRGVAVPVDAHKWLESTALMRGLLAELRKRH